MSDTTDDIMDGRVCEECMQRFRKAHGHPVLCARCYARSEDKAAYQLAREKEI